MAELLVRVVDKSLPDPYANTKLTKRGDVIVIQPDRWAWGSSEQKHPDWRIIRVPGVAVVAVQAFLAPEPEVDPGAQSLMLQRRAFRLDIESPILADAFAGWFEDAQRLVTMRRFDITLAQLLELKIVRPPIPDPNVLD